ncbi:MAG: DUF4301 family protein [Melioribacteraceae bacterium]|nr:DUF4301 family protein [Melioribacteraceae bacterium]
MTEQQIIVTHNLTQNDLAKINERGITPEDIETHVSYLKKGTKYVELVESCRLDNGITKVSKDSEKELIRLQNEKARQGQFTKFVPASGAASRMFKKLEEFMSSDTDYDESGDFVKTFFQKLDSFAFYADLKKNVERDGESIKDILNKREHKKLLRYLLTEKGMNYSSLPKALIKFHTYQAINKNSFEEQIAEAVHYIKDKDNIVRLHFTIPEELESEFNKEKMKVVKEYFQKGVELKIGFSFQKKSTDTVALDKDGELFRVDDEILFRPGGHGALIENLNDLDTDYVYIKNIDNVQREEQIEPVIRFKKITGGLLLKLQKQIFDYLSKLDAEGNDKLLDEIENFVKHELEMKINLNERLTTEERKNHFFNLLNRPIRVCGVVINEGHPGGGPFWVKNKNGEVTRQIIESDQVDKNDPKQKEIFESSTHFNPVDLVCGLKNYKGDKFDLTKYVDHSAVFISNKSKDGKELRALELPGLWNGAMSDWITIFVEVPEETFTPVKEVNDLLLDYHQ